MEGAKRQEWRVETRISVQTVLPRQSLMGEIRLEFNKIVKSQLKQVHLLFEVASRHLVLGVAVMVTRYIHSRPHHNGPITYLKYLSFCTHISQLVFLFQQLNRCLFFIHPSIIFVVYCPQGNLRHHHEDV